METMLCKVVNVCLVAAMLNGCDSTPHTPAWQAEPLAHAEADIRTHWTQIGDSWFTRNGYGMVQVKDVTRQVQTMPISEIDRMNGIEFVGSVSYIAKAQRSQVAGGWSDWQGVSLLGNMFAYYNFTKKNGKWTYQDCWYVGQGPLGGTYMAPSSQAVEALLK